MTISDLSHTTLAEQLTLIDAVGVFFQTHPSFSLQVLGITKMCSSARMSVDGRQWK